MKCSTEDHTKTIPYDAPSLKFDGRVALGRQIVRFVGGIRGERKSPVTGKQVRQWFRATGRGFVVSVLDELVRDGRVRLAKGDMNPSGTDRDGFRYATAFTASPALPPPDFSTRFHVAAVDAAGAMLEAATPRFSIWSRGEQIVSCRSEIDGVTISLSIGVNPDKCHTTMALRRADGLPLLTLGLWHGELQARVGGPGFGGEPPLAAVVMQGWLERAMSAALSTSEDSFVVPAR